MLISLFFFILTLLLVPLRVEANEICDLLDLKNCAGVTKQGRRSSLLSLPSPTTSTILNPATVSFDRGLGVEVIHQSGNPLVFSLASGTGKIGGALISSSLENTFFGNRVYEATEDYFRRNEEKKQYRTNKMNLALGAKLIRKKNVALDVGLILKRHSEIKKINPGVGLSGRLGPLTLGASLYQDDFYIKDIDYSEKFSVATYSVGTKYRNFSVDAGVIKTRYERDEMDTTIHLYAGSYVYRNFMFNLAYRNEISPTVKYIDGKLEEKKSTGDYFAGVQTSLGRHLIVGINYNYFLLGETSLSGTIFF